MTTFERVKEVVAEQLGIDGDSVKPETDLVKDLQADSLEIAEMLYLIEEEFNIALAEEDVNGLKTAGDVAALIDRLSK